MTLGVFFTLGSLRSSKRTGKTNEAKSLRNLDRDFVSFATWQAEDSMTHTLAGQGVVRRVVSQRKMINKAWLELQTSKKPCDTIDSCFQSAYILEHLKKEPFSVTMESVYTVTSVPNQVDSAAPQPKHRELVWLS